MKKGLIAKLIMYCCIGFAAIGIAASAVSLGWFSGLGVQTDEEAISGEIGLRGYYYSGDGSAEHPYEIVTSTHYYNLTRLQNLGFYPNQKYWRIGHVFDESKGYQCYNGKVDDAGNPIYEDFLDLGDFCAIEGNNILPIGSEGTPFVGNFQGNGIPIKNLTVKGYPEDIGVFGYVSYEGTVEGLVCEDLTIVSLGYSKKNTYKSNQLFGEDIDYIFDSNASNLVKDMSLSFFDYAGSNYVEKELKRRNVAPLVILNGIDDADKLVAADPSTPDKKTIYNGYFLPTFPPASDGPFTYSWKSSSPAVHISDALGDVNGDGLKDQVIVFDLDPLIKSNDFNSEKDMASDAKISLVATCEDDGFTYSRVIQSYSIEFNSNATTFGNKLWSVKIFCDYQLKTEDALQTGEMLTEYRHGNNIGFLAGHVNGCMKNCYLYNGTFVFNDPEHYHPVASESDIGLVGEIGKNVINVIDPERVLVTNGDTGSMNFSKIYSAIRSDFAVGDKTYVGNTGTTNYISYQGKLQDGAEEKYGSYLRHSADPEGEWSYLTYTGTPQPEGWNETTLSSVPTDYNSVDFIWNQLIEDKVKDENIFGVFKVATANVSGATTENYNDHFLDKIGSTRIINGSKKTKVYFSTAEYDHSKGGDFTPMKATTLPSVCDIDSFKYPFSRDYNYCFELDLGDMSKSKKMNYMYNTDSIFLQNYLSTKLRNKFGNPVDWGTRDFGFMFLSSDVETLDGLSAYMPVTKPGNTKTEYSAFMHDHTETRYYPSNSIVFSIDCEYGANVSIAGNGDDITIYGFDSTTPDGGVTPLYSMKNTTTTGIDTLRAFKYDVDSGETATTITDIPPTNTNTNLYDSGQIYGHIFHLPKGDYVVGARNANQFSNIYFLAVQGQKNASIGSKEIAEMDAKLENVDFLLAAPTVDAYHAKNGQSLNIALISFKAIFNDHEGQLFAGIPEDAEDKNHFYIVFEDPPSGTLFVTKMFVHSQHDDHVFYINGVQYTRTPIDLERPDS